MTSSDGDRARDTDPRAAAPRGRGLRNWRVRSRLIALIAVPTLVALALGAVGVGGAVSAAAAYGRVGTLADVAAALTTSVGDLQSEQSESAAYVGAGRTADRSRAVADAQRRTDEGTGRLRALAAGIGDAYPDSTRDRLRRALFRLDTLPALRTAVTQGRLPAGVTVDRYDTVVTDLLALDDEIAQEGTDPELSASVRALGALSRSRAALATQRALLESALLAGGFEPGGAAAFSQAIADQNGALQQFRTSASVPQSQAYDDVVAGADVDQTSAVRDGITAGRPPSGGAAAAGSWEASATGTLGKVGQAESVLVTAVSDRADQLRSDEVRQAWIIGIIALAVILIVLLATTAVARSLVRPLRALRDGALSVAERRLPDTVARLDREDPDTVDTRVEPIAVHSADEIGEVARSFDAVHQEAVRAAAGEARRRAQAGALFVTLSRRTQSLVDRQIELIDDLERGEEDADRLDSLFRLDHLATRMRRNGENLLVLGGQEPVRRWNRRLGLLEVLRAALSEIEQYPRVDVGDVPDVTLAESAVSDVVHLLAELLDNATAFSSRQSRVDVSATALPDGSALVEITDRGIGLTAQECEELGKRLAAPTEVGVDASRRMGLYVVGRLAARLGARVWLAPGSPRGVTASVTLPAAVLTEDPAEAVPGPRPEPSGTSEGAWIGERFSKAIATPGPGADSWFGGASLASAAPTPGSPVAAAPESEAAGAAAFVPTASGTTDAGLPLRRPGANEVPGSGGTSPSDEPDESVPHGRAVAGRHAAPEPERAPVDPRPDAEAADRSPDAIRERYARYQRGRRGAAGAGTGPASGATTAGPDPTPVAEADAASTAAEPTPPAATEPTPPTTAAPTPPTTAAPTPPTTSEPTPDPATESGSTSSGATASGPAPSGPVSDAGASGPISGPAPSDPASGTGRVEGSTSGPADPASPDSAPAERSGGLGTAAGVGAAGAVAAGAAWAASRGGADPAGTDAAGTAEDTGNGTAPDDGAAEAPPTTPMPVVTSGDREPTPSNPPTPSGTGPSPTEQETADTTTGAQPGTDAVTPGEPDPAAAPSGPPRPVMPRRSGAPAQPGTGTSPPTGTQPRPGSPAPEGTPAPDATTDAGTTPVGADPAGGIPAPDVPWGADAVREPTAAGSTTSGLPLRAPGANYVPGAVPDDDGPDSTNRPDGTDGTGSGRQDGNGATTPAPGDDRLAWDRSAEAIRRRFAAHQEGRRRGMERTGR